MPPRNETGRLRAMERELQRAEAMYNNVVGMEGKLKWRREIAAITEEIARLSMPSQPAEAEKQTLENDFSFSGEAILSTATADSPDADDADAT